MKFFTFEKSVGAVVFRETEMGEKEFLLLHYRNGHWDFPKGHMEKNETEEETLRREVSEETDIKDLHVLSGFREKMRYFYRAKGSERNEREKISRSINIFKKVIFYVAKVGKDEVGISLEHIGFEWLAYEKALSKLTFKDGKDILRKANDFLLKNY